MKESVRRLLDEKKITGNEVEKCKKSRDYKKKYWHSRNLIPSSSPLLRRQPIDNTRP